MILDFGDKNVLAILPFFIKRHKGKIPGIVTGISSKKLDSYDGNLDIGRKKNGEHVSSSKNFYDHSKRNQIAFCR